MKLNLVVSPSLSRKLGALEGVDQEFVIVARSQGQALFSKPEQASSAGARWTREASDALRKAAEGFFKKDREVDPYGDAWDTARVAFPAGGSSSFLVVSDGGETFEYHSALQALAGSALSKKDAGGTTRWDARRLAKADAERMIFAISALTAMAPWEPETFGKKEKKPKKAEAKKPAAVELITSIPERDARRLWVEGEAMGEANNLVRTLAELPANVLHPDSYRVRIQALAKEYGLKYEFLGTKQLESLKAGAFLAVIRADPRSEGGIAKLSYSGKGKGKKKRKVALIGKGLCFDTGGYNVKTGSYMLGMHGDMTGSAVALALVIAYAKLGVDFDVDAYLALAENLISETAYKPNEVVLACDGTAIEVIDTDAEGRMVLADTLALARRSKPDLAIDFATLTGAAIRAIDTRRGAVFSNREELARKAQRAGDESGERVWAFPIGRDYRKALKSRVADIIQCGPGSNADHIYAATFLSHFIGDETPWVHMDLVAAENKGGLGLAATDTTGFGVLWADALIRQ